MSKSDLNSILLNLSQAPDSQIDKRHADAIAGLIGQPECVVADELKRILDDCALFSEASDFAMIAMDAAWNMAKGSFGE